MKSLLIISCLAVSCFLMQRQKNGSDLWNALIKVNQKKISIYSNFDKVKIVDYIKNDTVKEEYIELRVIKKQNNMFNVKFASSINEKKVREGWIEIKYVGVYLRPHGSSNIYPIYYHPRDNSKYFSVVNSSNELIDVTDFSDGWLKIKMKVKGKYIIGWMQRKYLCANPYSTCD